MTNNNNEKILITGASGFLGQDSIQYLLDKGIKSSNIVALVRDESKVDQKLKDQGIVIRKGAYNNLESLIDAFTGIDKLLFISSPDTQNRVDHHKNVVNAAIKSNSIRFIAYTSFIRNDSLLETKSEIDFIKKSHLETEQLLQDSNIPHTILLNALYSDALIEYFFGPNVLDNGVFFPGGNGVINFATRSDLAEAAVNVLLNSDEYKGKLLKLAGNESNTLKDVANILSEIADKQVQYTSPSTDIYKSTLLGVGLPEHIIDFSIAFGLAIQNNEFYSPNSDLSKVLNRHPTSLKQFLFQHYKK